MSTLWIRKCCGAVIFALLIPFTIWSQDSAYLQLKSEFKKGNYNFVESRSKSEIEKNRYISRDDRWILLYVSSASDLKAMDTLMDRVYVTNKELTPIFYNSVFLLLERGLVVGDVKLVEKWGFRFRKNGQPSSRYAEGLYIYASMFYEIGRYQDANFILSLALKENPPKVVEDKILRLRDFIQKSG